MHNEINNKEIDHAKAIDVVMSMFNLLEYSDNYLKTSGSLWQNYRDEPFINDNGVIINVPDDPDNASFKYKQKITVQTENDGTKDVQIIIPLKHLSNFWRTLKMLLINCEINLILTWSDTCVLSNNAKATAFAITDTQIYVSIVTLSTQDNAKL